MQVLDGIDIDIGNFRESAAVQKGAPLPHPRGPVIPYYHFQDAGEIALGVRKARIQEQFSPAGLIFKKVRPS
jgi:hypothetical protein